MRLSVLQQRCQISLELRKLGDLESGLLKRCSRSNKSLQTATMFDKTV